MAPYSDIDNYGLILIVSEHGFVSFNCLSDIHINIKAAVYLLNRGSWCISLGIQYFVCYDIMGTNFEAILLSEDSTVAVVHAVSRAWDVDDKEADQEVADSKDQRHPKHPPSSCQIHEDLNQQILSLNLPENFSGPS